jgi:hypothetical protein
MKKKAPINPFVVGDYVVQTKAPFTIFYVADIPDEVCESDLKDGEILVEGYMGEELDDLCSTQARCHRLATKRDMDRLFNEGVKRAQDESRRSVNLLKNLRSEFLKDIK